MRNYYAGNRNTRYSFNANRVNLLEISQDKAQMIIDDITRAYEQAEAGKLT